MNPETTKTIFICYAVVLVVALLLAIPGTIWGLKQKLVVYYGKADLILSLVTLPIVIISLADLSFEDRFSWAVKIIGAILLTCSVTMSYLANQSIGKTIVVVATKYALVGLIAFCALLALGGLVDGLKAQRKKNYEDAVAKYATGALGAYGLFRLRKLIATFVKERPT